MLLKKKISDFLCKGIRHYTENNANSSVKISRRQKHCFLFFKTITVLTLKKKRKGFDYSEAKFASCQRPKNGAKIVYEY